MSGDDSLHLGMSISAEDHASAVLRQVQQSLNELEKTAKAFSVNLKKSLGGDLAKGLTEMTGVATKFGTQLSEAAARAASALKADVTAADAVRNALAQATGEANRLSAAAKSSTSSMQASARAASSHAQAAATAQTRATRDRIRDVGMIWRRREASERAELRHLSTVRREQQAMRREMSQKVSEVYGHGRHALRSVNHPAFESAGFWVTAGAVFGLEAGKHLIEAAKQIDTATIRYSMMPGVSPADAAKVRGDALREGMRIGVDPSEIVRLQTQALKDGLSKEVSKALPAIVNAAAQIMGGSRETDGDELARAVREASTVGWVKDAAGARSFMNSIAGLSNFGGNSPQKMKQFLENGGIGRGKELGWSEQQTLAFGAALNGSGERSGLSSARLMAQLPEIRAQMRDRYIRATRSREHSEENRAVRSAPSRLGYAGGIAEMQQAFASPEGVTDFLSRLSQLPEQLRASIEKGFGLGPQFNAVAAEMGADHGQRYKSSLARESQLSSQNAGNDDLSKNQGLWSGSIEFMIGQLKASVSAVQSELGDVLKSDILEPFTKWWVNVSEALLNSNMKADLHRAIQAFIQGLGFTDLTAALNSLRSSIGTFDFAGFMKGVGEGLRAVLDQMKSLGAILGGGANGLSAETIGRLTTEFLGLSLALRFISPVVSLVGGLASGILAVKAAVEFAGFAARLTGFADGLKAFLALDLAGGAAALASLVGGLAAMIGLAKVAADKGILEAPKSFDSRGILNFLDPNLGDMVLGRQPGWRTKDDDAFATPRNDTLGADSYWAKKKKYLHLNSFEGGEGPDNWRNLMTKASYEPSDADDVARTAAVSTARGVYDVKESVDRLSRIIKDSVTGTGSGGGDGPAPGHAFGNLRYGRSSSGAYRSSPGGAGAGGASGMTAVSKDLTPESRALLDTLASGEAPDYNVMNGGGRFLDYSHHPGGRAAGRYQFLPSTWKRVSSALGLKDFSPESQDKGAWWLAQQDYAKRTGRDLSADLKSKDPSRIAAVGRALHSTWVSLNGSFGGKYQRYMDRQSSGTASGAGGASVAGQVKGNLTIDGESYRYGSGGAGGSSSVPFGDYPINPDSGNPWGKAHNAMDVNGTGTMYDKSLGRLRTGIEMHAASTAEMITHGCLGFLKDEYPKLKAQVKAMIAKTGHAYLHVGPNGATITPNKESTADVVKKVIKTSPAANSSADNSTTNHNVFNVSHPDPHKTARIIADHLEAGRSVRYTDAPNIG